MVGQVTDVIEWAALGLAAISAEWAMIGLTVDLAKFLYSNFNYKDM